MIHLHWAVHSHQPVGNFDFIFERAFAQAYGPFLDVLASHPRIRMSMHFSGILLDWLEARRPEYLTGLRGLVERGQVEILGGGYYEPILPVISDAHKVGQLRKLQEAVKRLFGVTPRGLWLAERVWEPTLVKPISEAGLEFVVLDGSHFKMVGKTDRDMDGYFLSEDQGNILKLFPIHDVIRDYIPFRPVEEVVEALLKLDPAGAAGPQGDGDAAPAAGRPGVQVVFGDDGEKFGDWPGTHNTVFADRWLHRFFEAVEGLPGRIRVETLESGLRPEKNLGLVYLPPASYQEMMVWAQDARDIPLFRKAQEELTRMGPESKFLRGTFWRNFFNKYPESNQMHKQGIRLSALLEKAAPPAPARDEAREHIWQSQCNCAYWHGVFGGLYLPHLRFALYRHLIQAQKVLDGVSRAKEPQWEVQDWNCDGKPEYTLNTPEVFLSFTHAGEIDQFWLKGTVINLVDTLTRRFEAYHEMVGGQSGGGTKLENQLSEKESNLRDYLVYDQRIRHSLADLFLEPGTDFRAYARQEYRPLLRFDVREVSLRRGEKETAVRFLGLAVEAPGDGAGEVRPVLHVEKTVALRHGSADLRVEWRFRRLDGAAESDAPLEFRFASENLFCLLAGNAPDRYLEWDAGAAPAGAAPTRDILASRGEMSSPAAPGAALKTPGKVALTDEWLKLRCEVRFAGAARAWRDALETVSQSEGGYERVYQGTVVAPVWDFRLAPGGEASAALSIQIREAI